jgi:ATP-dependent RNA helicase RhlB
MYIAVPIMSPDGNVESRSHRNAIRGSFKVIDFIKEPHPTSLSENAMDFQRFGIDPRLAQAAEGLATSFFFYEKMLTHVVTQQENVCVKIALDNGREEVILLPALQWLLSGEGRRVLIVVPSPADGDRCAAAIERLGSAAGISLCQVARDSAEPESLHIVGESGAAILIGMIEDLLAVPDLNLRDFGFLVVDGVDRLVELPSDAIRKFSSALLPSWERRSVLTCARFTAKAKNLAWDLADNPSELSIEGEVAKAQSVLKETWNVPVESKLKFLLGLLSREKPSRLCVFCNLRDTAGEVSRRLAANGISTDSILGPLSAERKFALIEKFRAGDSTCLVLSDEGSDGLSPGVFPLIVNFDIPLEPELFVKRLEMLDRSDPSAKVVSLACDRYIYGLPAVEQYIDAKLDALPADESMLSAADKSEGLGGKRKPKGDGYPPRDSRRGSSQRRDSYPREARPRETNPRDAYPRDAYPRESRNPDIRKSISEATGGALEINGELPPPTIQHRSGPNRPSSPKPASHGGSRRGQRSSEGRPAGKKDGFRVPPSQGESRREDPRRGGGKPSAQRATEFGPHSPRQPIAKVGPERLGQGKPDRTRSDQKKTGQTPSGMTSSGNPYDMPIEERMRLYREKYGRGLGGNKAASDSGTEKSGSGRSGPSSEKKAGPSNKQMGTQRKARKPGAKPDQGNVARHSGGPSKVPESPKNAPISPAETERKPESVVGRLLGAFKKKHS